MSYSQSQGSLSPLHHRAKAAVSWGERVINVAYGTKAECEQWRKEIIRGDYNIPVKDKHLITDYLSAINEKLDKISGLVETFVKKQEAHFTTDRKHVCGR